MQGKNGLLQLTRPAILRLVKTEDINNYKTWMSSYQKNQLIRSSIPPNFLPILLKTAILLVTVVYIALQMSTHYLCPPINTGYQPWKTQAEKNIDAVAASNIANGIVGGPLWRGRGFGCEGVGQRGA